MWNHRFTGSTYPMIKVAIETHGCKLNQADSQLLASELQHRGFKISALDQGIDVYILNTCTVTHIADRKARNSIRKAKRMSPKAITVVTGCYAERDPVSIEEVGDIDLIIGNSNKKNIVDGILSICNEIQYSYESREKYSYSNVVSLLEDNSELVKTRAMLKIQEGCNQVCSYCIVPKVRGREVSVGTRSLVENIKMLEKAGYREVVLTGTQLGSYGFETKGNNLYTLISTILDKTSIERIRVSSLQPQEITSDLLGLWSNQRLCPHFHVPLQSGNNEILKGMRRRYSSEQFIYATELIAKTVVGSGITTDVIVGFPGETDKFFQDTFGICAEAPLSDIHVFPYSRRPGTSAYYIKDQVKSQFKSSRVSELMDLARNKNTDFIHKATELRHNILWEKPSHIDGRNIWSGLTGNYIKVLSSSTGNLTNTITNAEVYLDLQGILWARDPIW